MSERPIASDVARFIVRDHRKTSHRGAYATARADLLNLVDKGLLEKKTPGGTMYFEVGPPLARA